MVMRRLKQREGQKKTHMHPHSLSVFSLLSFLSFAFPTLDLSREFLLPLSYPFSRRLTPPPLPPRPPPSHHHPAQPCYSGPESTIFILSPTSVNLSVWLGFVFAWQSAIWCDVKQADNYEGPLYLHCGQGWVT